MSVTPARDAALGVLRAAARGRRLDRALADAFPGLPERERGWVHELVYGTVRLRGRLDHLLDHHLHRGRGGVEPALLDVLRLGAYQLLHMGSVPPYAAVSQAVEQARRVARGRRAGGLANAVLRAVEEAGEDPALFPAFEDDPAGHLATWGSHPRWLVQRWLERWPAGDVRALVDADNAVPPLFMVPLDGDAPGAAGALRGAGIGAREVGGGTTAVELPAGTGPAAALAAAPPAVIQDPGASLVVPYADPDPDAVAADLCAAPGGKALVLARRAAYVVGADASSPRLRLLRDNVERTGVRMGLLVARAEAPPLDRVPLVLVDVPCTGTGTLRRHPDARWRLRPGDVGRMAEVQRRILDGAARVVAPGGVLVYATCSLETEENEAQVEAFLRRRPDFRLDEPGPVEPGYLDGRGRLAVRPWDAGFDAAFAARLRRIGTEAGGRPATPGGSGTPDAGRATMDRTRRE